MKQKLTFRTIVLTLCCLIGLVGCEQNVDLNHIDARVAASMGIALPIGEMSASLGDFVKAGTIPNIYIREDGVYYYQDTMNLATLQFQALDSNLFNVHYDSEFALYETLHELTKGLDVIIGDGSISVPIDCPLLLTLNGVNDDIQKQRVDSIEFESMTLRFALNTTALDVYSSEIDSLSLVLGNEFHCSEGNKIDFDISQFAFGDSLSVELHHVCLRLMNDPSDLKKGNKNTLTLHIKLQLKPQAGHKIYVKTNSALQIDMNLWLSGFQAIWGYFVPDNSMSQKLVLSLDSLIGKETTSQLKSLKFRIAEPELLLRISHHISMPMILKMHSLYAYHPAIQQRTYATWNGNTSQDIALKPILEPTSLLTDSVTATIPLSYRENEGHIDCLFDYYPDSIGLEFGMGLDSTQRETYPQHRIVSNTSVYSDAILTMPFVFKENTSLGYAFTLDSINISALSLDSLLPVVKKLDTLRQSDLRLFLTISNGIPFAIKAKVSFLDANNQEVNLHPLVGDSLYIAAPTNIKNHMVMEPKETDVIVSLTRDQWRTFAQVKKIRLDAFLGDNPATVQLDTDAQLKLRLGLSAKTEVVYNFNNIFDGKEGEK